MDKIINNVSSIYIDNVYKLFNEAVYLSNNKKKSDETNINDIYDEVLIISDENVYFHQGNEFIKNINAKIVYEYIVLAGEESKSLEVYEKIINYCKKINLSRKSLIIALGGGVVGDLAGFVASTYMRGIDVVQVPTSLLAQVDSSIGGKTAINLGNIKNIIGSFYQPKLTYINIDSLKTLPYEEFIDGMAEVIKYGVIYDYNILNYLIENKDYILNRESDYLYYIVKRCAQIKAEVVERDEKESGLRKILNFGHTFGHGVEKLLEISHGKAVSIGMSMAFKLALDENMIDKEYYDKLLNILKMYNLPTEFNMYIKESSENNKINCEDENLSYIALAKEENIEEEILNIMKSDKKNSFSKINLILPNSQGEVVVLDNIENEKILNTIKECINA